MKKVLWIPALALLAVACGRAEPEFDLAAYEQEVMDWRAGRLERLLAPTGFLTQIGLHWLEPGTYSIGSGADNDIVVPATAAARIGEFEVSEEEVRFTAAEGVEVLVDDVPVAELDMPADVTGQYVIASHRSLAWSVIDRYGNLAVRIRDFDHPFVKTFGPLPYFDIDPAYRVTGILARYDEPREIRVKTVIEGYDQFPLSPGTVSFELGGERYELEPTISGDMLFFVFADETARDSTYGAGRFLYAEMPGDDGKVVIDFNKAYSAPCAFNDFSTCPIASPRNRLPVRIEAGEKFSKELHYSGAAGN
jgi:uncharacterized protein (DUF1684 family)